MSNQGSCFLCGRPLASEDSTIVPPATFCWFYAAQSPIGKAAAEVDCLKHALRVERDKHAKTVNLLVQGEGLRNQYVLQFALHVADLKTLTAKLDGYERVLKLLSRALEIVDYSGVAKNFPKEHYDEFMAALNALKEGT